MLPSEQEEEEQEEEDDDPLVLYEWDVSETESSSSSPPLGRWDWLSADVVACEDCDDDILSAAVALRLDISIDLQLDR